MSGQRWATAGRRLPAVLRERRAHPQAVAAARLAASLRAFASGVLPRRLLLVLLVDLFMACVLQCIVARGDSGAELEMESTPLARRSSHDDDDGEDDEV